MKISKNSWHWKLLKFARPSLASKIEFRGTTLCSYFWDVIFALLQSIILVVLGGVVGGFALYMLLVAPIAMWFVPGEGVMVPGVCGIILWVGSGIGALVTYLQKRWQSRRRPRAPKEPGLVSSYIRAKKEKFCPILKVE